MVLKNINTNTEYLRNPFVIKNGTFVFNNDKLTFENFNATCGKSDFKMNGFMQNAINFVMTKDAILKGNFTVNSNFINVDEFMNNSPTDQNTNKSVVIIPSNFDLVLNTTVKKLNFEDLRIEDLKGNLIVNKGKINFIVVPCSPLPLPLIISKFALFLCCILSKRIRSLVMSSPCVLL